LLNSFYQKDLARGITEEALREDLAYFLLQFTAIGNYWNQPVYLGGENADGSTVINDLSYVFLDVYDRMGIFNPKIQIKVADSTPRSFLEKALDMVRRGHNCIVFVSDATIRRALVRAGASEEDARLCDVKGCYEYSVIGSYGTGMIYANMMKPLEYALHKGCDGVTGVFSGNESPAPESYESFEAFMAEYKKHLLYMIDTAVETVNGFEDYLYVINPLSLLSATFESCLEKKKDAIGGGGKRNGTGMSFGFLADAADSLAMIEKYVFEKKLLTLKELKEILDNNFDGNEELRQILWNDPDKYGNNRDLPDFFAADIVDFCKENVIGKPNAKKRGGFWATGFHVARQSYMQGAKTMATPNGRKRGEELSKNCSA
jgi:formate C-acetyltransferase